ncbi:hypothetical protein BROUX41_006145 [Berkeleyomyces rouxiae]|uniref:uncharacterized protein n=1 Tax=Berkeleyomyces rouxiae TaxID=2035830 RepID=UPI003B7D88D7
MSPTYTMSAHLCKQICSSWRQTASPSTTNSPTAASTPKSASTSRSSPSLSLPATTAIYRPGSRCSSPPKRSADSDHED